MADTQKDISADPTQDTKIPFFIHQAQIPSGEIKERHLVTTTAIANGDILYGDGNNNFNRIAIGSSGQYLSVAAGIPSWATIPTYTSWVQQNASVQKTSNQAISTGTTTDLTFDTENYDSDTMADLGTHNDRLTVTHAGVYLVTMQVLWAASAAGVREVNINGVPIQYGNSLSAGGMAQSAAFYFNLAAAATIKVSVFQDSGGDLNVTGAYLQAARIG